MKKFQTVAINTPDGSYQFKHKGKEVGKVVVANSIMELSLNNDCPQELVDKIKMNQIVGISSRSMINENGDATTTSYDVIGDC